MDNSEFTIKLLDKLCELVKNCQNKEDVLEVIDNKVSSPIFQSNKDVSNTESPSTSFNTEASNSKNEIENLKNEIELKNKIIDNLENSNNTLRETEQNDKKRIFELENIEKELNNKIESLNVQLNEMSEKKSLLENEISQLKNENYQLKSDKANLELRFREMESELRKRIEVITNEKSELEERNTLLKQNFKNTSDQLRSIQEKYSSIKDDDLEILVNLSNVVAQCSDNLSKQGIRIDSILGIISYFGQISNLKNNWNDYVTGAAKDLSLVTDTENNFFEILSQIYNKANPDEVLQLSLIMPEQNSRYDAQTHARPNAQTGKFVKSTIIPGVGTQNKTYVNPLVEIGD